MLSFLPKLPANIVKNLIELISPLISLHFVTKNVVVRFSLFFCFVFLATKPMLWADLCIVVQYSAYSVCSLFS